MKQKQEEEEKKTSSIGCELLQCVGQLHNINESNPSFHNTCLQKE